MLRLQNSSKSILLEGNSAQWHTFAVVRRCVEIPNHVQSTARRACPVCPRPPKSVTASPSLKSTWQKAFARFSSEVWSCGWKKSWSTVCILADQCLSGCLIAPSATERGGLLSRAVLMKWLHLNFIDICGYLTHFFDGVIPENNRHPSRN